MGCVIWQGADQKRYAVTSVNGKTRYVHRLVYEAEHGEIPPGVEIHHICENKLCINPDHLIAVDGHKHRRDHHSPLAVSRGVSCPKCGADRWKQGFYHGRKNGWNCMDCRARRQREWRRSI
jgi:hypothetical protein